MPIQFTCPFCGAQTNVADRYAGQTGPCAQCGQQITIPGTPAPGAEVYTAPPAPARSSSSSWVIAPVLIVALVVVLGCAGILIALLLPAVQAAREAARRAACMNNMKQVSLALHNYHDAHRQFPPAYVTDKNGKPLYSWRVLILPYMERNDLYQQFHLDEPWDSPANQNVTRQTGMSVFRCPSNPDSDPRKTDYVMIVGPHCISDGPTPGRLDKITDGTSRTIMLAEIANSDINWAEPRDLDAATMSYQIDDSSGQPCIGSSHHRVANIGFADGSVRSISGGTDPELVRQMVLIDDRKPDTSAIP